MFNTHRLLCVVHVTRSLFLIFAPVLADLPTFAVLLIDRSFCRSSSKYIHVFNTRKNSKDPKKSETAKTKPFFLLPG